MTRRNLGRSNDVSRFTVSVLQTFDPSTSEETVERVESLWKTKPSAKLIGCNQN